MQGICPTGRKFKSLMFHVLFGNHTKGRTWKRWNVWVSLKFPIPPELSHSGQVGLTWQYFGNQIIFQNFSFNHTSHSWKWAVMHHLWGYLCWLFLLGRILCLEFLPFLCPFLFSAPALFLCIVHWQGHEKLCSQWLIITHYSNLLSFVRLNLEDAWVAIPEESGS